MEIKLSLDKLSFRNTGISAGLFFYTTLRSRSLSLEFHLLFFSFFFAILVYRQEK
jgi:hypothetical protein